MTLLIFPSPLQAHCELRHDSGWTVVGVQAVHPSGRLGQAFEIPEGTPHGHGARLTITAPKKVPLEQRGVLFLNDGVWFAADDFVLVDAPSGLPPLVIQRKVLMQEIV